MYSCLNANEIYTLDKILGYDGKPKSNSNNNYKNWIGCNVGKTRILNDGTLQFIVILDSNKRETKLVTTSPIFKISKADNKIIVYTQNTIYVLAKQLSTINSCKKYNTISISIGFALTASYHDFNGNENAVSIIAEPGIFKDSYIMVLPDGRKILRLYDNENNTYDIKYYALDSPDIVVEIVNMKNSAIKVNFEGHKNSYVLDSYKYLTLNKN